MFADTLEVVICFDKYAEYHTKLDYQYTIHWAL